MKLTFSRGGYFIARAFSGLRQNLFTSVLSISTIAMAMVIFGSFLFLYENVNIVVKRLGDELTVVLYLKGDGEPGEVSFLKKRLMAMNEVAEVTYTDKAEALSELSRQLGEQKGLLEGLKQNPLPASLDVRLKKAVKSERESQALLARFRRLPGVDDVQYSYHLVKKVRGFINLLRLAGMVLGGFLFLATVLIVSNTIRITVYARRQELEIMRLVGASETFIRAPFIIEGIFQGLLGALFAEACLFSLYSLFFARLPGFFRFSGFAPTFLATEGLVAFAALGAFLGYVGSFLSLRTILRW